MSKLLRANINERREPRVISGASCVLHLITAHLMSEIGDATERRAEPGEIWR